jgi:hypothetical protein
MFGVTLATIIGLGLPAVAIALLVAALAAYLYIPVWPRG